MMIKWFEVGFGFKYHAIGDQGRTLCGLDYSYTLATTIKSPGDDPCANERYCKLCHALWLRSKKPCSSIKP